MDKVSNAVGDKVLQVSPPSYIINIKDYPTIKYKVAILDDVAVTPNCSMK